MKVLNGTLKHSKN